MLFSFTAEFRGPGVHHNFDDSENDYENDVEQKGGRNFGIGGYKGRIIFLGDGTEVLTDSDDTEMFDNAEEDKDLESQVSKNSSNAAEAEAKPTTESAQPSEEKKSEADQTASTGTTAASESKPEATQAETKEGQKSA